MPSCSLWIPPVGSNNRVLTSATLDDLGEVDRVTLFVEGELVTRFEIARGLGARLLCECGLVPAVVSDFLANGRRGQCSPDEIRFLSVYASTEPDTGFDDLESLLLLRRASASGSDEDRERLNEALRRQAGARTR